MLDQVLAENSISSVLHFAALKAVSERVSQPQHYYDNNVHGSQVLLQSMADAGIYSFVFRSSSTVYGEQVQMPISETCLVSQPTNPYGRSKLMVDDILRDPNGTPNNLLPYIAQVAGGKLSELEVYGNDYPTHDGTGVRDYSHVVDLAGGHFCALNALETRTGVQVWNLGTGKGYSVLDIMRAFEAVSGKQVPYHIAKRDLPEMIHDAWRWQQINSNGYRNMETC